MRREEFFPNAPGRFVETIGTTPAFVPDDLPPDVPPTWELAQQLAQATAAVSELSGVARNLSNPHLLIHPFLRREALLSSQIEGTQTSLSALFYFEASESAESDDPDVEEVVNYVRALEQGFAMLPNRALSLALLRDLHYTLMQGVRGHSKTPGAFRTQQNWIGTVGTQLQAARYVPPPPLLMLDALDALENFIQTPSPLPVLIRIALVHYQFEAIHPFEDGNGRIGRLLITLMLCGEGLMPRPLLYLSAFFEKHRQQYIDLLLAVSQQGDWPAWLSFFLQGVTEQAQDGVRRVDRLLHLRKEYEGRFTGSRASLLPIRLLDELFANPVMTAHRAAARLQITPKSAQMNIEKLIAAAILQETTGRQRNRVYAAPEIIHILESPAV